MKAPSGFEPLPGSAGGCTSQSVHMEIVYFLQVESGPIKIGRTRDDPYERLRQAQVHNHEEVELLAAFEVPKGYEKQLHRELWRHRIRGEWFRPDEAVFDAIEELDWVYHEAA